MLRTGQIVLGIGVGLVGVTIIAILVSAAKKAYEQAKNDIQTKTKEDPDKKNYPQISKKKVDKLDLSTLGVWFNTMKDNGLLNAHPGVVHALFNLNSTCKNTSIPESIYNSLNISTESGNHVMQAIYDQTQKKILTANVLSYNTIDKGLADILDKAHFEEKGLIYLADATQRPREINV